MKVLNFLPLFLNCMRKWESLPSEREYRESYITPIEQWLRPMFDDFSRRGTQRFYPVLEGLSWPSYRQEALSLDPQREELRLLKNLRAVEALFDFPLQGEVVLFGAFTAMDGYARFDRGAHRVFLGVDESHGRGAYLDVLETHELTHVARESRPEVWEGFGLSPQMTHDEFTEGQPVIEHLMSEGFSCAISEILSPAEGPWNYVYQTKDSLERVLQHGPAIDRVIHEALRNPNAAYGTLYDVTRYVPEVPRFSHYVWAWQWVKRLLATEAQSDPKKLLNRCSKDFVESALDFRLSRLF